jgi:CheY-like chemotaxis protein
VAVDVRGGASADGRMAVRIEVRDTGIGLSDSAKRKLFQKFQQADGSITRRYGGTGLGLSISRQLVNLMGGEIGVADGESGGATFWVELELAPGAGQARVCRCKLAGARILVVDPGALNRDTFRRQLQDCGAEVAAVDGAEACLAALDEAQGGGAPFDLVLMDEMAGAAGEALVRGIRDGAGDVQPAIVMVASMAEPITARRAEEIGLDGYLTKPVRHQALGERLASILGRGEGDQAAEAEASAPRIAATPHGPVRVLLAEDNEINILLVRTILDQVGFSVRCVTNGREAVEAARNEAFDLILMDVQMPVMDGLEATRRIRALGGPVAQTPIVAMTANAMRRDREACLAAGMDDFISKPIDAEMFLALLDRLSSADPARSVA